jgi:hypothetical protein
LLGKMLRTFELGIREEDRNFLPSEARCNVVGALQMSLHGLGNGLQARVASYMTISIVVGRAPARWASSG